MHSAVPENTDRYHYDNMPSCEDAGCHIEDLGQANVYHQKHFDELSCYVCHSLPYNNCTDCHVNNEWKTDPYYQNNNPVQDFRIGLNPIKSDAGRLRFKFATVRHIPIAPKSFSNWGAGSANLPGYNSVPTWKYTSPHSIQRRTALTDTTGGKQCMESCHISSNPENKKYFLFKEYVETNWPDEVNANEPVYVDGKLPDDWN